VKHEEGRYTSRYMQNGVNKLPFGFARSRLRTTLFGFATKYVDFFVSVEHPVSNLKTCFRLDIYAYSNMLSWWFVFILVNHFESSACDYSSLSLRFK
jgi:hypothetical protein